MNPYAVRGVEERLADPTWRRPERIGYALTLATLGCFTFVWFGVHALRQFHTARRELDETWAVVWGSVALVSMWLGAGLDFSTRETAGLSVLVWTVRLGSLFHVHVDHAGRMRAAAAAEVARERDMISGALGHQGHPATGSVPRRPDGMPRMQAPGPSGVSGRFEVPVEDPFAAGPPDPAGTYAGPPRATPQPARGRSWGRLGSGDPAPGRGRRLESPAARPPAGAGGGDAMHDPTMWVPGLEPDDPPRLGRPGRDGRDGKGDPAAPPSGRVLDL